MSYRTRLVIANLIEETPSGSINGSNTVFTTANSFVTGSTRVYLNGIRQKKTDDYTETAGNQFSFVSAPLTGDNLIVDYIKS